MNLKKFLEEHLRGWLPKELRIAETMLRSIRKPVAIIITATLIISVSIFAFYSIFNHLPTPPGPVVPVPSDNSSSATNNSSLPSPTPTNTTTPESSSSPSPTNNPTSPPPPDYWVLTVNESQAFSVLSRTSLLGPLYFYPSDANNIYLVVKFTLTPVDSAPSISVTDVMFSEVGGAQYSPCGFCRTVNIAEPDFLVGYFTGTMNRTGAWLTVRDSPSGASITYNYDISRPFIFVYEVPRKCFNGTSGLELKVKGAQFSQSVTVPLPLPPPIIITPHPPLTPVSAEVLWNKTYGGAGSDVGYSIVKTMDGGYAIGGSTSSFGNGGDMLLLKIDATGNLQWNKTYGGDRYETGRCVIQTSDGGYALIGTTNSYGPPNPGNQKTYLVKTDANGNMQWNMTYVLGMYDVPSDLIQTKDGGYAIAAITAMGSFANGHILKTDANGTPQWDVVYGPNVASVIQTSDGGFVVVGTQMYYLHTDKWVYLRKLDANGSQLWWKTFGENGKEMGRAVVQTRDGGYAIAAYTPSFGAGSGDLWLIKTDASGNMEWNQTYGGTQYEDFRDLIETSDGGFALVGYTDSFGAGKNDLLFVKTDANGNVEWSSVFGGTGDDYASSVLQASNGDYVIVGYTDSIGAGSTDVWLIKINSI